MGMWFLIIVLGVLKLPLVGFLLWMPFRSDQPVSDLPDDSSASDDGGSKTPPSSPHGRRHPRHPRGPLPRQPRRGPHGGTSPAPPERVRRVSARARRPSGNPARH